MSRVRFIPADEGQREFFAYLPDPIPSPRDGPIDAFIADLLAHPEAFRKAVEPVSERGRSVLTSYAERMANLAIRKGDKRVLRLALTAELAGGLVDYEREALMTMALVDRAAQILETSLYDVARTLPGSLLDFGREAIDTWMSREPDNRSINAMGFEEGSDSGGFRFQPAAWMR